jgi:hypothetical protein
VEHRDERNVLVARVHLLHGQVEAARERARVVVQPREVAPAGGAEALVRSLDEPLALLLADYAQSLAERFACFREHAGRLVGAGAVDDDDLVRAPRVARDRRQALLEQRGAVAGRQDDRQVDVGFVHVSQRLGRQPRRCRGRRELVLGEHPDDAIGRDRHVADPLDFNGGG